MNYKRLTYVVLLALSWGTVHADPVSVKNLRMWRAPDHTRLVFDLSTSVEHRLFLLTKPDRLVIDLENASLQGSLPRFTFDGPYLRGVRTGAQKNHGLRIVLDLKSKVRPRTFVLTPNDIYGHRLVIDLFSAQSPASAARKGYVPTPRRHSAKIVVAIDPGHGGEDPGAVGRRGTKEKHVTLKVAKELYELIKQDPDMRPVLIRGGDYYVSLRERILAARRLQADAFISIHADAFPSRRVRGSSVYALSARGASNEEARWLADKENAADLVGGVSLRDKDDLLARVLLDLSMTKKISDSMELGQDVLRELSNIGPVHRKRVQQAGFVVLKAPDIPSILIETAFLSNPKEEQLLRSVKHRRRLATAIFKGIQRYFRRFPIHTTVARIDNEYVVRAGDSLSAIAARYNTSVSRLKRENKLNGNTIRVGQKLRIPRGDIGG